MSWAKAAASAGIAHGVAAELDDHGLPVVALHVRQGLGQDARLRERGQRRRVACARLPLACFAMASSLAMPGAGRLSHRASPASEHL